MCPLPFEQCCIVEVLRVTVKVLQNKKPAKIAGSFFVVCFPFATESVAKRREWCRPCCVLHFEQCSGVEVLLVTGKVLQNKKPAKIAGSFL